MIVSVIEAWVREDSAKLDEEQKVIERLHPGSNRLELFARRRREGGHAWGMDVPGPLTTAS